MQTMAGTTAGASRWALSAGTMLVFGGGLALFQMTSLVLGSAGSRQLHVSLTMPVVAADDPSESSSFSADRVLGTRRAPDPTPAVATPHAVSRCPSGPVAVQPAAGAVGATSTTVSVTAVDEKALMHRAHKPKPHDD
jgi:hypothetical protein